MRILLLTLTTFSRTGGIEKFNRCFAKALEENAGKENWEIRVLSAYDEQPDTRYISSKIFKGFSRNRSRFLLHALKEAARVDAIIFGHINLAVLINLVSFFFPSKKLILLAHGIEVWNPLSALQSRAIKKCSSIWCVSNYTAKSLTKEKGIPENKIRIFPNTLDPFFGLAPLMPDKDALKKRYHLNSNNKVILTVNRLSAIDQPKGYDQVIKAMVAICQNNPGTKYLLCGKADNAELERLTQLIDGEHLKDSVILAGFIPDEELLAHYQMADMFVMPSRKEGFGIVFIEAAWLGLPVIAGNKDGSVDALLDGALGILIDPDDQQALESAILSLLESPLSAEEKSKRKKLVDTHFGFEAFKRRQAGLINN